MGHSAKITRGGNKKRVNQARQEAKLRAQGAKAHTTSVQDSVEARRRLKQRAAVIAGELKAKAANSGTARSASHVGAGGSPIVRMAPRVQTAKKSSVANPSSASSKNEEAK